MPCCSQTQLGSGSQYISVVHTMLEQYSLLKKHFTCSRECPINLVPEYYWYSLMSQGALHFSCHQKHLSKGKTFNTQLVLSLDGGSAQKPAFTHECITRTSINKVILVPYCIVILSVMICDGKLKSLHQFILNLYSYITQGNKSSKKGYNSQCMALLCPGKKGYNPLYIAFVPRQGQI